MIKLRTALVFVAILLAASAKGQNLLTKVDSKHSLELAYYSVKQSANDNFQALKEKTFAALKKQPGLVAIHSYQDIEKPNQYVDIVIWETLDNAKSAEQNFVTLPEFKDYNASLEQVLLYSHGDMVGDGDIIKSAIDENSIMEFVAYTIKDQKFGQFENARLKVFDVLGDKFDGFLSARTWQSVEQPQMVMDVIFWDKIETARKAFEASAGIPEFAPFNETIGEIKLFGDYKKVY